MRFSKEFKGNACKNCLHKLFWQYSGITAVVGWFGIISFFATPFFILNNLGYYLWNIRMPPVPPNAKAPTLNDFEKDRLEPYIDPTMTRLNQGEPLDVVLADVAKNASVTPAQVLVFMREALDKIQGKELSQTQAGGAKPLPLPPRTSNVPIMVAATVFCGLLSIVFFYVGSKQGVYDMTWEPVSVDLAAIAGSSEFTNRHIKIGPHESIYPLAMYNYSQKSNEKDQLPIGTEHVTSAYYLVLIPDYAKTRHLQVLKNAQGYSAMIGLNPKICVIIRTKRFQTINQIPIESKDEQSLEGVILNGIDVLSSDEVRLIKESYPGLSLKETVFIEEDRIPFFHEYTIGTGIMGCLAIFFGLLTLREKKSFAKFEEEQRQKKLKGETS